MLPIQSERRSAAVNRFCQLVAAGMLAFVVGAAEAKTCFKAPREIGAPADGLIYRSRLDAAAVNSPATIDFRTGERYLVEINRSAVGGAGNRSAKSAPIGLKILLKDCHLSAYWSQLVSGIKAPGGFRRNGASAFSAYWSQRVFGVMEPVVGSTGISD